MHASSSPPPVAIDPKLSTSDLPAISRPESLIPKNSAYVFPVPDDEEVTARLLAGIAELDAEHAITRPLDDGEDFHGFTADDLEDES